MGQRAAHPATVPLSLSWVRERPRVLVVACSDGRLQRARDEFLSHEFKITDYDRLYLPGGGGALWLGRFWVDTFPIASVLPNPHPIAL